MSDDAGGQFIKMNPEQAKAFVRWLIATTGPILISHGYLSESSVSLLGGIGLSLIPLIWGMFAHTDQAAIGIVDTLAKNPNSGIKAIVTDDNAKGRAIADSLTGHTTVVAGPEALEIVKAKT